MSRYSEIQIALRERDLIREARSEPIKEHKKLLYKRNVNKYYEQLNQKQ